MLTLLDTPMAARRAHQCLQLETTLASSGSQASMKIANPGGPQPTPVRAELVALHSVPHSLLSHCTGPCSPGQTALSSLYLANRDLVRPHQVCYHKHRQRWLVAALAEFLPCKAASVRPTKPELAHI